MISIHRNLIYKEGWFIVKNSLHWYIEFLDADQEYFFFDLNQIVIFCILLLQWSSEWYHSLKIECRYFWETEYLSKPIVNYLCGYFVTRRPGDFWNIFLTKLCSKKNFIWKVFHSLHIRMQFWRTVKTWMQLYRQGREIFPKRIMLVHW